jgi:pseudoazurin
MKNLYYFVIFYFLSNLIFSSDYEVKMLNSGPAGIMVFDPPVIKIEKGDTVHFKSVDMAHNSQSIEHMMPTGGDAWMGGMSQDVSVTFDTEGVYVYQCAPHLMMAMVGVIQVGNNNNLEDVKQKANQLKNSFVTNKDRLNQYLSEL